jgi:hypothetical protein
VRPTSLANGLIPSRSPRNLGAPPGLRPIRHNGTVNDTKWINPHQPQTLYMAVILCYVEAFFAVLSLGALSQFGLLVTVALAAGAFGIANEKRWGYALAVAGAVLQVLLFIGYGGISALGNVQVLISFAFDVLLVVLLLHPMSRSYQRIWFK